MVVVEFHKPPSTENIIMDDLWIRCKYYSLFLKTYYLQKSIVIFIYKVVIYIDHTEIHPAKFWKRAV